MLWSCDGIVMSDNNDDDHDDDEDDEEEEEEEEEASADTNTTYYLRPSDKGDLQTCKVCPNLWCKVGVV